MKTIKLVELELENVGGVKSFYHDFNGEDAIVKAQNGVGKTTLYTSVLWLLFNKNTEGKTAFGIRPVHTDKTPVRGLTVSVRATFDVDGEITTLKKINTENNTTIFLVEQNANQALQIADRGYVIENGKITLSGTAESLLTDEAVQKAYLGI